MILFYDTRYGYGGVKSEKALGAFSTPLIVSY